MEEFIEEVYEEDMKPCVCNLKQLAGFYGVDVKTMRRWLRPFQDYIGKRNGYYFLKEQCRKIFRKLGAPTIKRIQKIIKAKS